jgi:hypothetical protein
MEDLHSQTWLWTVRNKNASSPVYTKEKFEQM